MARAVNINRGREFEPMVQRICVEEKLEESGKTLFPTIREFLSFCAMLGYSEGRNIPIDRSKGVEDIAGAQYEHHEAIELVWAIGIAHTKSSDILKDGKEKECAEVFESFANGGLSMVREWIEAQPDLPAYKAIQSGLIQAGYFPDDAAENPIDLGGLSF